MVALLFRKDPGDKGGAVELRVHPPGDQPAVYRLLFLFRQSNNTRKSGIPVQIDIICSVNLCFCKSFAAGKKLSHIFSSLRKLHDL